MLAVGFEGTVNKAVGGSQGERVLQLIEGGLEHILATLFCEVYLQELALVLRRSRDLCVTIIVAGWHDRNRHFQGEGLLEDAVDG